MKTNKKFPVTQWIRHGIQLAAFFLYPGLFISVFTAIRDVIMAAVNRTFSMQTEGTQLLILLAVFPITVLWGRFFCGYLCSFGAMGDLVHFLSSGLHIRQLRIPETVEKILTKIKYAVFVLILLCIWLPGTQIDSSFSPWSAFGLLTTLNFQMLFSIGSLFLLLIIVGSLFIERFFCRYLCPLGAVFSLTSAGRLFKIRRKSSGCIHCGKCRRECPAALSVDQMNRVSSGECIDCLKCADCCPTSCIHANPAPAAAGTAAALTMMGLVYAGRIASGNLTGTGNSGTASVSSSSQGKYTDGTYTGSGQSYRGTTTVEVTVFGGNITDIMVISYADDDEFFNKAKNSVLNEILSSQSTDVDTVSGATFSSSGLISAVADALSSSVNAETESTDASDAGASVGSSSGQNNSSDESGDTNAGQTENASSEENSVSSTDINPASLADGTYTGSGTGLRGATEVSVTVESGKITDITVTSYADDQQFFERAETTMIEEILSAQSIQVSTVSGATFSSNSILEAVADALGTDWTNPNSSMPSGGGHGGGHGNRL